MVGVKKPNSLAAARLLAGSQIQLFIRQQAYLLAHTAKVCRDNGSVTESLKIQGG